MADPNYGMLGQIAPGAASLTSIYTVPATRRATVKVVVTNRGAAQVFRVAVSPNGAGIANEQYIAFDMPLDANDSLTSAAITLSSGDIVRGYSSSGNGTFSVTGIEEDE